MAAITDQINFSMRQPITPLLLLGGLLFLNYSTRAQQVTPPVADTTGYEKGGYGKFTDRFYYGTLTKMDGTVLHAYLPANRFGYERIIDYFPKPPIQGKLANGRTKVKMKKIKSMEVRGRVYETVQRNGKNSKIMSMRLVDGPITLGVYAEPRTLFIPIPLAVGVTPLAAIPLKDKPHYYLRRDGTCVEVPRAHFAEFMSAYFADNAALASKIHSKTPGYQFINAAAIVAEYNRAKADTGRH